MIRRPMRTWVRMGRPSIFPLTTLETWVFEQRRIAATSLIVRTSRCGIV